MTTISSSLRDGFQPEDIETIGLAISEKIIRRNESAHRVFTVGYIHGK